MELTTEPDVAGSTGCPRIAEGRRRHPWRTVVIIVTCLSIGAAISVLRGQDANWDLRNYHLYNGWAAMHGRLGVDLAAAGLQTWINPTLDIPYAWLALGPLATHPRLLAAFMGLWYGALIAGVLGIAFVLYRPWPPERRWLATASATLLAVTGAAVFSQVGTTFNEIQTGALVLASVLLLAREIDRHPAAPRFVILLLTGTLLGAAVGLKMTSAVYAPAAALAFIAVMPIRRWPACLALMVLGGIAGFALGGGWWAYKLYETYGNPVFPFFNGIFRSPWYPPINQFDQRFLPQGIWQDLFYPFFWLSKKPMTVAEYGFRDARIPLAYALIIIAGVLVLARRFSKRRWFHLAIGLPQWFVLAFAVSSYVLWLCTTSILRYATPVEATAALLLPCLLGIVLGPEIGSGRHRAWMASVAVVSVALLAFTRYPAWERMSYGSRVVEADMCWVQPGSLVVFVGAALSYVAPFVPQPQSTRFLGLSDAVFNSRGWRLADAALAAIQSHRGPITIIWSDTQRWRLPSVQDMGLTVSIGSCRHFFGTYDAHLGQQLYACAAKAEPPQAFPDPL